jgi:hypothetical protein
MPLNLAQVESYPNCPDKVGVFGRIGPPRFWCRGRTLARFSFKGIMKGFVDTDERQKGLKIIIVESLSFVKIWFERVPRNAAIMLLNAVALLRIMVKRGIVGAGQLVAT